jgi:hypothetical protein
MWASEFHMLRLLMQFVALTPNSSFWREELDIAI